MLKNSGKTVYVTITYDIEENWAKAFDPANERTTNREMDDLVEFLQKYNIKGVIMEQIYINVSKTFLDFRYAKYSESLVRIFIRQKLLFGLFHYNDKNIKIPNQMKISKII